jgi:hypothetical protein
MNVQPKREGFVDPSALSSSSAAENGPLLEHQPVEEMPVPAPPPETWPVKVRLLHKSISNGKSEIKEITFREPTGADINRIGNPVRIDQQGEIIIDDTRMLLMMGNLSGVLTPLLERMDPRDYNSCAYRLRNFFIPELAAWLV